MVTRDILSRLRKYTHGDLVCGESAGGSILTPFIDRRNGGSLAQWVTTLDAVLKLDFDTAIPGHGPVLTKENVRTFHQNLVTLRQRMIEIVKAGATKEDLAKRLKTDDLGWPLPQERVEVGMKSAGAIVVCFLRNQWAHI